MFVIRFSSLSDTELIQLAEEKLTTDLADWERNIWQFIRNWFNPSVTSIKIFTSGSTGSPKQIEHSKQAMLNSARMTGKVLDLKEGDNTLLCLPTSKIAGMMMVVRSICTKMDLHCIQPSATPLKDLEEGTKISFAAFTPMQLHSAAKNFAHFKAAQTIDKIIVGGEAISAEVLDIVNRFSNKVYHTFGMTETISHIALKRLNGKEADAHYQVLDGITISTGEQNRLIIEAPELSQPHLVTNDVVRLVVVSKVTNNSNETYNSHQQFDWLGRTDNVINSGGVKIYPEELEQKLQSHIQPAFFITAIPDEVTGNKLVLAIEMISLTESDKQELREEFSKFDKLHRPKAVLLFGRFVKTTNGKTRRKETMQGAYERIDMETIIAK